MNTSRIPAALALAAAASLTCGCGSSPLQNCRETRSCSGSSGAGSGMAGGGGGAAGGAAGSGGSAEAGAWAGKSSGSAGSGGAAGTGDTAGGGGSGLDDSGSTCSDGSTCRSGHCVDGACCDTKCDGTCESCGISGSEGTCTPYANGTDPESECLGGANAGDPCAGSCDGSGACTYPTGSTSCGNPMCAAGKQTTYGCGSDGSCAPEQTSCGNYTCGSSACRSSCTSDGQCVASAFCNTSNKCVPRKADGGACNGNDACTSGHCIGGVCCHTDCAAPSSCSTGQCLCNGKACAGGHACITWYLDQDGDGFGAKSSHDTLGCDNVAPPPVDSHSFVTNADDCYDHNANARPGQKQYFTTDRGDGSFDYDCDGAESWKYPATNNTVCQDCGWYDGFSVPHVCRTCGASNVQGAHHSMGMACTAACGGATVAAFEPAFAAFPPACGQSGTLLSCAASSCSTTPASKSTVQPCR